ncbi:MAG: WYL domain-containing protein [Planctomycetota bacterium]|nr:WYL domain-containing protein [Planctomycetota bacterium]
MALCPLCLETANAGIPLCDGRFVHEDCLGYIEDRFGEVRYESQRISLKLQELHKKKDALRSPFNRLLAAILKRPNPRQIEAEINGLLRRVEKYEKQIPRLCKTASKVYDRFLARPPDWSEREQKVAKRHDGKCCKCGGTINCRAFHRTAPSMGGNNTLGNLEYVCSNCRSSERGEHDTFDEFSEYEREYTRYVSKIRFAIMNHLKLGLTYFRPKTRETTERVIEPYSLVLIPYVKTSGESLCVRGFCHLRMEVRTFAIPRILNLKLLDEKAEYEPPT